MKGFKNKLIFNDIDFSEFGIIEDVRIPFISITNQSGNIPGKIGGIYRKNKINGKTIEVDLRLIEEKREDLFKLEEKIKECVITNSPKKLFARDYIDKYFLAILDGEIDFKKFLNTGFITLKFISFDGIKYSKEETKGYFNNGNIKNYWILKANITSEVVKIIKEDTLEKIQIDTSKYINQKIEINSELEIVKINDNLVMDILHFDSDFFMLDLKDNKIKIEGLENIQFTNRARWI